LQSTADLVLFLICNAMLSSLLRPKRNRQRLQDHSSSSPYTEQSSPAIARQNRTRSRFASADFTATEDDDETDQEDNTERGEEDDDANDADDNEDDEDEDEDGIEDAPLLPLFSEAHLGQYYS
jgi:hypothetical protein